MEGMEDLLVDLVAEAFENLVLFGVSAEVIFDQEVELLNTLHKGLRVHHTHLNIDVAFIGLAVCCPLSRSNVATHVDGRLIDSHKSLFCLNRS